MTGLIQGFATHIQAVHRLGGVSFKPKHQINIVVCIFWQNVTGKFGDSSQHGLHVSDGHCKSNSSLERQRDTGEPTGAYDQKRDKRELTSIIVCPPKSLRRGCVLLIKVCHTPCCSLNQTMYSNKKGVNRFVDFKLIIFVLTTRS